VRLLPDGRGFDSPQLHHVMSRDIPDNLADFAHAPRRSAEPPGEITVCHDDQSDKLVDVGFRDHGIEPANGLTGDGFIVRSLLPDDVVLDHEAVMSSREFLPTGWG